MDKLYIVDYLIVEDGKKKACKEIFNDFNCAVRFIRKIRRWKKCKYYVAYMRDKVD